MNEREGRNEEGVGGGRQEREMMKGKVEQSEREREREEGVRRAGE